MLNNAEKANGKGRMGKPLLIFAWLFVVILIAPVWYKPWKLEAIALAIVGLALFFTLAGNTWLWNKRRLSAVHWTTLNHTLPLLFILLPPIFTVLFFNTGIVTCDPVPSSSSSITIEGGVAAFFFPTYYSLMVVVATIFILLQTEIEDFIQEICPDGSERKDRMLSWRLASTLCLLFGLTAALLYALPYAPDVNKCLSDTQKFYLFAFGFPFALAAPVAAIWMRDNLTKEQDKLRFNEFIRKSRRHYQ